jgi:hypothetical protein
MRSKMRPKRIFTCPAVHIQWNVKVGVAPLLTIDAPFEPPIWLPLPPPHLFRHTNAQWRPSQPSLWCNKKSYMTIWVPLKHNQHIITTTHNSWNFIIFFIKFAAVDVIFNCSICCAINSNFCYRNVFYLPFDVSSDPVLRVITYLNSHLVFSDLLVWRFWHKLTIILCSFFH